MQFQVPQFLDVEDKIIGPLTAKQFVYILGGAGGAYIIYRLIPWFVVSIIPALAFLGFGLALAFYKFNGKPFIRLVESGFLYLTSSKMYVWRKREKPFDPEKIELNLTKITGAKGLPAVGGSKLNTLHWQVDAPENLIDRDALEADDRN